MGQALFIGGAVLLGCVGLVLWYEARRGARFFEHTRRMLDRRVSVLYRTLVFGEIPSGYRTQVRRFMADATHRTLIVLVKVLRAVERPLVRLTREMRYHATTSEPSHFIKTIKGGETKEL